MSKRFTLLIALNLLVFNLGLLGITYRSISFQKIPTTVVVNQSEPPVPRPQPPPDFELTTPVPSYLAYSATVAQLRLWKEEAPEISEVGTYGKSSAGNDLVYFRVFNPNKSSQPVVLVTAAIHGNESWSTGIIMGYIGTMLDQYGNDEQITKIVDTTDVYFVPIVCPDSYPDRRESDGMDPNRNFPTPQNPEAKSVQSVQALREFFLSLRPKAVISGHTWGRVYLQPYGDTMKDPPNHADYQRIVGKMSELSQYGLIKAAQVYRRPISGSEMDWYYRRGAFAIVTEYGTHQHPPTHSEIMSEFNRTFQAFLYFLTEGPKVQVTPTVALGT